MDLIFIPSRVIAVAFKLKLQHHDQKRLHHSILIYHIENNEKIMKK